MTDTQFQLKDIDFEKIQQKEVKKLIETQIKDGVSTFDGLHETYYSGEDISKHRIHEKIFLLEVPLEVAWKQYMITDPSKAWNGNMITFALMVSGKSNEIFYPGEKYNTVEVGQIFYLSMNIFARIIKVAVSHKIIGIDHTNKIMTLSYVAGGETIGKQDIKLTQTTDGNTKITHTTFYRGKSEFREKYLYPFFHTRAVKEFHSNIRNSFKPD